MTTPIIQASGLGKRYQSHQPSLVRHLACWLRGRSPQVFWALRDLDLDVNPGKALAILGHNGSGKSTLLKLISGVTQPSCGRLQRRGRIASLLELGAGFHPELTGRDNVFVNGALLGMSQADIRARCDRIVAFAGVEAFTDTPVKWYSSGMYLRLGFAVAAHMQADCLLIDEVLAVGDLDFRIRCYDRVAELRREGTTLIYVSHDLWSVQRLCSRAVLLDHGRCLAQGDAVEVIECYPRREGPSLVVPPPGRHLSIESVDLLAAEGTLLRELDSWGSLALRIRFLTYRPMDSLVFVIRLHTANERVCATLSDADLPRQTHSGPSETRIGIANLPLAAGDYFFFCRHSRSKLSCRLLQGSFLIVSRTGQGRAPFAGRGPAADSGVEMKPAAFFLPHRESFDGVSIIVPVYNALPHAQACVEQLLRTNTAVPFEIIVVDDGSQPPVRDWLLERQHRPEADRMSFLSFDANRGFAAAVNAGADVARGSMLCLLNSDTLVTPGWLERLTAAMKARPDLGLVGPVTNMAGNRLQVDPQAPRRPNPHALEAFALKRQTDQRVLDVPGRLVFFCVLIRKDLWQQLGGVCTDYGSGNFEDDDFCLRARMAGYRLAVVPGAFVYHHNGLSFRWNRLPHADLLQQNGSRFARRAHALATTGVPVPNPRTCATTISVVVPFIDPDADLQASLRSLARQTLSGFEVVVGNGTGRPLDPACDPEVTDRFRLREVVTGPSRAEALNGALAHSRGEVIAYLPAGDVHYPFHLEVILQHLESAAVVCTGSARQLPASDEGGVDFELVQAGEDIALTWVRPAFPLVAWAHRRRCLETVPTFDPSRDPPLWDWQLRLLSTYAAEQHPYVTCVAGPKNEERPGVDQLMEIYGRFPAWDRSLAGQRHHALVCLQRDRELAAIPMRQGPAPRATELARTLYRRTVPYEGRLAIDRTIRRLVGLPPMPSDPACLVKRVRDVELRGPAAALSLRNGRDIIQFGANPWDDLYQRQQHFAALLGGRGHRIFYIGPSFHVAHTPWWDGSPLRELAPGVLEVRLPGLRSGVYGDDCLGASEVEAMEIAFQQLARLYAIQDPVCLVHVPQWMPLIAGLRKHQGWPVVYDCLDDQEAFITTYGISGLQEEQQLVEECDELIVTSAALRERWQARRRDIRLLPNACDYELFAAPPACPLPLAIETGSPIIGYYGTLSERMDLRLLKAVAEARPEWQFVFVGRAAFAGWPQDWWQLTRLANVHILPPVDQRTLAGYLSQFQVCLLPFHDNQMTRAMNFVKLYEYLAAGKPVVSAQLREVEPFAERELVRIYDGFAGFITQVEACLREPAPVEAARRFVAEQTWEARVDVLERIITGLSGPRDFG